MGVMMTSSGSVKRKDVCDEISPLVEPEFPNEQCSKTDELFPPVKKIHRYGIGSYKKLKTIDTTNLKGILKSSTSATVRPKKVVRFTGIKQDCAEPSCFDAAVLEDFPGFEDEQKPADVITTRGEFQLFTEIESKLNNIIDVIDKYTDAHVQETAEMMVVASAMQERADNNSEASSGQQTDAESAVNSDEARDFSCDGKSPCEVSRPDSTKVGIEAAETDSTRDEQYQLQLSVVHHVESQMDNILNIIDIFKSEEAASGSEDVGSAAGDNPVVCREACTPSAGCQLHHNQTTNTNNSLDISGSISHSVKTHTPCVEMTPTANPALSSAAGGSKQENIFKNSPTDCAVTDKNAPQVQEKKCIAAQDSAGDSDTSYTGPTDTFPHVIIRKLSKMKNMVKRAGGKCAGVSSRKSSKPKQARIPMWRRLNMFAAKKRRAMTSTLSPRAVVDTFDIDEPTIRIKHVDVTVSSVASDSSSPVHDDVVTWSSSSSQDDVKVTSSPLVKDDANASNSSSAINDDVTQLPVTPVLDADELNEDSTPPEATDSDCCDASDSGDEEMAETDDRGIESSPECPIPACSTQGNGDNCLLDLFDSSTSDDVTSCDDDGKPDFLGDLFVGLS